MYQHKRRFLHACDDIGHRERFAGPGHAKQRLVFPTSLDPRHELINGLILIPAGFKWSFELER